MQKIPSLVVPRQYLLLLLLFAWVQVYLWVEANAEAPALHKVVCMRRKIHSQPMFGVGLYPVRHLAGLGAEIM